MHLYNRALLLLMIVMASLECHAMIVSTQQQFDEAMALVRKGESVSINLLPGTYHLSEHVIAKAPFSIVGTGSTISSYTDLYSKRDAIRETATHYICKLKHTLSEYSLMVDSNGNLVEVSESVKKEVLVNTAENIEGDYLKSNGVEVRIPIPDNLAHLKNKLYQKAFGYFDIGWSRMCFTLKKADSTYFYCKTLHLTNVPRYDYEKSAYKSDIRFVIYNAEIISESIYYDNSFIYIPKSVDLLKVKNCDVFSDAKPDFIFYGDVTIKGVTFDGINGIMVRSSELSKCSFTDCTFSHSIGNTLKIAKQSEKEFVPVLVRKCSFKECSLLWDVMLDLSSSYTGRKSIFVNECKFVRYPDAKVRYKNTSAMVNVNADAIISDCTLWNTCRCHLYFTRGNSESVGNVIYNTPEFNTVKARNLSNDWGLIYVNHVYTNSEKAFANKWHKVIIERCFLYGAYAHANDARGVMIDNGRGDVICKNNVVLDCQCYSLDARDAKSFVGTSSIRNVFENNILGTRYRLSGGVDVPMKDRPISKGNILLSKYDNVFNERTLICKSKIVIIENMELKDGKMFVSREDSKRLKRIPFFNRVKKFIKTI